MRIILWLFLLGLSAVIHAKLVVYNLTLATDWLAPDGYWRKVYTINGQSPGPALECNEGDTLRVHVQNHLPFSASIHFHGIEHKKTPWMDGVPGVTQFPILPQDNFTYEFVVRDYGAYWYHTHVADYFEDGIRGPMFIRPADSRPRPWRLISDNLEEQRSMEEAFNKSYNALLFTWRHEDMSNVLVREQKTGTNPICMDSVLLNGQGRVHCPSASMISSEAVDQSARGTVDVKGCQSRPMHAFLNKSSDVNPTTCSNTTSSYPVITASRHASSDSRWASINLVNAGGLASHTFSIDGHDLWVVAADGEFVVPQKVQAVDLIVGTRYTVLVRLDQPLGDYTIRMPLFHYAPQLISGFAVFRVDQSRSGEMTTTRGAPLANINAQDGEPSTANGVQAGSGIQDPRGPNYQPLPPPLPTQSSTTVPRFSRPGQTPALNGEVNNTIEVSTLFDSPAGMPGYPAVNVACLRTNESCSAYMLPLLEPLLSKEQSLTDTSDPPLDQRPAEWLNGWNKLKHQQGQVINELPVPQNLSRVWTRYNGTKLNGARTQNDSALAPVPAKPVPRRAADLTIRVNIKLANVLTWVVSPQAKPFQSIRFLQQPLMFRDPKKFNVSEYEGTVIDLRNGSLVDIIFEQDYTDLEPEGPPPHPLHKHQSKVWVLGQSEAGSNGVPNKFNFTDVADANRKNATLLNMHNPPWRDGWQVPSAGWAVVRFQVAYPSATLMHCHIGHHL